MKWLHAHGLQLGTAGGTPPPTQPSMPSGLTAAHGLAVHMRMPRCISEHWEFGAELNGWRWPRWKARDRRRADGRPRHHRPRDVTDDYGVRSMASAELRTPARRVGPLMLAYTVATLFWAGVTRYGEARHPGPALGGAASTGTGTVVYPRPLRPGFRDVRCSGFGQGVPGEAPLEDKFQLEIETVNATAWRSAVRRLERSSAQVVLVQETRVLRRDVPKMSAQARRRGWQTLWTPAVPGKRGKASGGVAICARLPVALSAPPRGPVEVVQGRAVAGMIEAPGCRPTVVYSAYLRDGVGANEENLGYLARIGAHSGLQPEGVQKLVGADFNLSPQALDETDFPARVDGTIVSPGNGATTCRTSKSASLIDYFVMSKGMAKGVESVSVVERSGVKTHAPVVLRFHARLTSLKALALRKPPALGAEPLIGPRLPPPDWGPLTAALRTLSAKATRKGGAAVDKEFQAAFERWADLAEKELHAATGVPTVKAGTRGRPPRLFWRSILPEKVCPRSSDAVVAVRALASIIDDARRVAGEAASGATPGGTGELERRTALRKIITEIVALRAMPGADVVLTQADQATRLVVELLSGGLDADQDGGLSAPDEIAVDGPPAPEASPEPASAMQAGGPGGERHGQDERGRSAASGGGRWIDGFDLEEDPFAHVNADGG